jgi:hypothetical protein
MSATSTNNSGSKSSAVVSVKGEELGKQVHDSGKHVGAGMSAAGVAAEADDGMAAARSVGIVVDR